MNAIEARPYGPLLTAAERETLRSQVSLRDDGIVSWREAPVTTTYQIDAYAERLAELVQPMEAYLLLVDLTDTIRPSPEVLERLREFFSTQTKMRHAAVFTGKNFLLNVAAQFVLARIGFGSYSVHKTRDDALAALRSAAR